MKTFRTNCSILVLSAFSLSLFMAPRAEAISKNALLEQVTALEASVAKIREENTAQAADNLAKQQDLLARVDQAMAKVAELQQALEKVQAQYAALLEKMGSGFGLPEIKKPEVAN